MSADNHPQAHSVDKASQAPRIGLALGGGGARGWAHIEVIQALEKLGIHPDIVAGTSMGALVGAAHVTDNLEELGDWVRRLRRRDVVGFLDLSLSGGFIEGKKLFQFFRQHYEDKAIESLSMPYAAVATRLDNGQEIWLRDGMLMDAVRASIAVPGFFTPSKYRGRWLVDGGLTNPVPVSVCRALGADIVIAVGLQSASLTRRLRSARQPSAANHDDGKTVNNNDDENNNSADESASSGLMDKLKNKLVTSASSWMTRSKDDIPSMLNIVADSIDIMQSRIMRSRMAGDPPDIIIAPQVEIGFLEFHRAREAMEAGAAAVERVKDELEDLL